MLKSSQQRWVTKAEVWSAGSSTAAGTLLETLSGVVIGGSVTVTATSEIRRTCTLQLESRGRQYDNLVPVYANTLLHPATGNLLKLYRGFTYDTGATDLVPLGVFVLSQPKIKDTNGSIVITITGNDLAALVSRQAWTAPQTFAGGTPLGTVIRQIIAPRLPYAAYAFTPTTFKVVPLSYGVTLQSTNDPFADAQSQAAAAGMALYFGPSGICTMQPVPTTTNPSRSWTYYPGPTSTLTASISRTLDETKTFNGIIARGNGTAVTQGASSATNTVDMAPVTAVIWTTTPNNPARSTGPWGRVPYIITTDTIPATGQTPAQAQAAITQMAKSQAPLVFTALDEMGFSCVPNPAMLEGDVVQLERGAMGVDGLYVVKGLTIPLGPTGVESVTLRPKRFHPTLVINQT
jgi:hypothetical protein